MTARWPEIIPLIPARGGSKSIKNKNLMPINGQSLLARSVASVPNFIDKSCIFVSSDSKTIIEEAERLGVSIHHRSQKTSSDSATAIDVIKEFIDFLSITRSIEQLHILYLQPTSPFRTAACVEKAIDVYLEHTSLESALMSVSSEVVAPSKMLVKDGSGSLIPYSQPQDLFSNRQTAKTLTKINGAIYLFRAASFKIFSSIPTNKIIPYEMDRFESIDIDDEFDLDFARFLADGNS